MTRKHGLVRHHEANWMEQDPTKARPEHSGYFPNTEDLSPDEFRVIILGSGMPNARKSQASASILVELGNGEKFIFDIGSESVQNLGALEIPYDWLDKVFITHLHRPPLPADLVPRLRAQSLFTPKTSPLLGALRNMLVRIFMNPAFASQPPISLAG